MGADGTPVIRVELKRATASELIGADPVLASAPLVKLAGMPSLASGGMRRHSAGAVIFQQGEAGDSLFFILAGDVKLQARRDRDAVELGILHRGDVLGEGEAHAGTGGRRYSAVTTGQVDVLEVPRKALLVGSQLPARIASYLKDLHAERMKSLDEMSDFLNRW